MRICLGLRDVAGYYPRLLAGFRDLGIEATFLDLFPHPFGYAAAAEVAAPARWFQASRRNRLGVSRRAVFRKLWWIAAERLTYWFAFLWALVRHDVFIFGFNSTFFRFRELPLLRRLGKRVIYIFHGSDSRPPYIDGARVSPDVESSLADCLRIAREHRDTLRWIEAYAHAIVANPLSAQLHRRPFGDWFAIGIPTEIPSSAVRPRRPANGAVRILHCPSHRVAKGTEEVRAMIERLRIKGMEVEYIEISGQPNAVVLEEMARSDIVVDQLYSDTPMAGLATEAAARAIPAVVGGYAPAAEFARAPVVPPTAYAHPAEVEGELERLVRDAGYRRQVGERARRFVEDYWSPREVASRLLRLIRGEGPADWLVQPSEIRYFRGVGMPEERARASIRAVLEAQGEAGLYLEDKPELKSLVLAFARGDGRPDSGPLPGRGSRD